MWNRFPLFDWWNEGLNSNFVSLIERHSSMFDGSKFINLPCALTQIWKSFVDETSRHLLIPFHDYFFDLLVSFSLLTAQLWILMSVDSHNIDFMLKQSEEKNIQKQRFTKIIVENDKVFLWSFFPFVAVRWDVEIDFIFCIFMTGRKLFKWKERRRFAINLWYLTNSDETKKIFLQDAKVNSIKWHHEVLCSITQLFIPLFSRSFCVECELNTFSSNENSPVTNDSILRGIRKHLLQLPIHESWFGSRLYFIVNIFIALCNSKDSYLRICFEWIKSPRVFIKLSKWKWSKKQLKSYLFPEENSKKSNTQPLFK